MKSKQLFYVPSLFCITYFFSFMGPFPSAYKYIPTSSIKKIYAYEIKFYYIYNINIYNINIYINIYIKIDII